VVTVGTTVTEAVPSCFEGTQQCVHEFPEIPCQSNLELVHVGYQSEGERKYGSFFFSDENVSVNVYVCMRASVSPLSVFLLLFAFDVSNNPNAKTPHHTAPSYFRYVREETRKDESITMKSQVKTNHSDSFLEFVTLRTIFWTLFGVLISILTLLYLGDVVDSHRIVPLSDELLSCLSRDGEIVRTVNSIEIWAEVDVMMASDIGILLRTLDNMKDNLVENTESYDTVGMLMSQDGRGHGTFFAVSRCERKQPITSDMQTFCDKDGSIQMVGELRDFMLFGDRRSRFYTLSDHRRRFAESTAHVLREDSLNPRASPWFEIATQGPKEGIWLKYLKENRVTKTLEPVVVFAKTFRARGNSVVPGMPGGGVVFAAANSAKVSACEPNEEKPEKKRGGVWPGIKRAK